MDFKKKKRIDFSFLIIRSSKFDFMKYVIDFTQHERKFFMSIALGKQYGTAVLLQLQLQLLLLESVSTLMFNICRKHVSDVGSDMYK